MPLAAPESEPTPASIALMRRAVAALPERERKAVCMRYFDELPAVAIASELGVSTVNARRIVFNGLRRLRTDLGVCA
jgi:RNA polymerase sigma factor (sigma-70 family)